MWFSEVKGKKQVVGVEDNSFEVVCCFNLFYVGCFGLFICCVTLYLWRCLKFFNVSLSCHGQQVSGKAVLVLNDAEMLLILDFTCSTQHWDIEGRGVNYDAIVTMWRTFFLTDVLGSFCSFPSAEGRSQEAGNKSVKREELIL